MKLITLYRDLRANDNVAQFESSLEVDLELAPNSSIALASANVKYNDDFITFNQLNSRFNLFVTKANLDNNEAFIVQLEEGNFNKVTILENLQSSINASLPLIDVLTAKAGLSCRPFFDTSDKLNIAFGKLPLTLMDPVLNPNDLIEIDTAGVVNTLRRAGPVGGNNFNAFTLMDKVPVNKGNNRIRFQTVANPAGARWVIGLLNEEVDYALVSQLPPSSYVVSLSVSSAGNYTVNDQETAIPVLLAGGQVVDMIITEGVVQFDVDGVQVGNNVPYRENLGALDNYVYASLFQTGCRLTYQNYFPDPFFGVSKSALSAGLGANPNIYITIDFAGINDNTDLGEILGFNDDVIQIQGNQSTFTADEPLNFEVNEDAGVNVVIENLPLKSFNFTDPVNRAQPILHSIPQGLRTAGGVISYTAPFLIPIELNNRFPINLRSLRFSIRNVKDNGVLLLDEVSLAMVIT